MAETTDVQDLKSSWWATLPGTITKLTALISAITALATVVVSVFAAKTPAVPDAPQTPPASTAVSPTVVAEPIVARHAHAKDSLAPKLLGMWTWDGACNADSPRVAMAGSQLVFTTPTSRFTHRIVSDDGSRLRTQVEAPPEHRGEPYEFSLQGDTLVVQERQERNQWHRCTP